MKALLIVFFLYVVLPYRAQKGYFNFVIGAGPSYCFKEPVARRHVNRSEAIGVNYMFSTKKSVFIFNPGINFQSNDYHASMMYDQTAHVTQRLLNATLDVLVRAGKHLYLRAGLFINKEFSTHIMISRKNSVPGGYYSYGNSYIEKSYYPAGIQAGTQLGISIPFHLFKREQKFNITWIQFASPLVSSDYILTKNQVGEDVTILSARARPSALIFSLEFNLQKKEKPKKEEE